MHLAMKLGLNQPRQCRRLQARIFLQRLAHEGHHRRIELVGPSGPAFFRHQTPEAVLSELALDHVEMTPREAEIPGRLGNRSPFFLHTAQHLVLDLNQVFAIEEGVLLKQPVRNPLGMGIQGAGVLEQLSFLADGWIGHAQRQAALHVFLVMPQHGKMSRNYADINYRQ
jgi:hypothetical protein